MNDSVTAGPHPGTALSPQQRRLWQLDRGRGCLAYCEVGIRGPLEVSRLDAALARIQMRHQMIRMRLRSIEGVTMPLQVVDEVAGDAGRRLLSSSIVAEADSEVNRRLARARARASKPVRGPAMRASLIEQAPGDSRLLLQFSPFSVDRASLHLIVAELAEAYERSESTSESRLDYLDVSDWLNDLARSPEAQVMRDFWRSRYEAGAASFALHGERAAGSRAFRPEVVTVRIPADVVSSIRALAARLDVERRIVLLTALYVLSARLTDANVVTLCPLFDGRSFPELAMVAGPLARHIPVSCAIDRHASFSSHVREVDRLCGEVSQHQEYFAWPSADEMTPCTIAFEFDARTARSHGDGVEFRLLRAHAEIDRWKVKVTGVEEADGRLGLEVWWDRNVWSEAAAARFAEQIRILLTDALTSIEAPIGTLMVAGPDERAQALQWGAGARPRPATPARIDECVTAQAARWPERVAVVGPDASYRYDELDAISNQIARTLQGAGVRRGAVVPLLGARGARIVAGMLGVMKAGAAYAPLNLEDPPARLTALIQEVGSGTVVGDACWRSLAAGAGARLLALDEPDAWASESDAPLPAAGGGEDLAYAIYTSGSTGGPKAVGVRHASLTHYAAGVLARLGVTATTGWRFAVASALHADLGHTALYGGLASGGAVHIVDYETATDGARLAAYLASAEIDVLKIVPSHWEALWATAGVGVLPREWLVFGGERLRPSTAAAVRAAGVRALNHYGPTETTVGCLTWDVADSDLATATTVPIGRPLPGTHVYVVDAEAQLAPLGVTGELWIGGTGVARGYLGRPALTAARFVPDPWGKAGARVYRSGDRVRYDARGAIEFLGRIDGQVKVRGYRIEPGEIEAALNAHPAVLTSVVIARDERDGTPRLVGYVVPRAGITLEAADVQATVRQTLPEYMWPQVEVLASLPRTRNGKIDRAALAAREVPAPRAEPSRGIAPRDAIERDLVAIWETTLGREGIGVRDNFFASGGHSLLAITLLARVEAKFSTSVSLLTFLQEPTIEQLASYVRRARGTLPRPVVAIRAGHAELPLFLVHPAGGSPACYAAFANALEPGRPVYGFQAQGLEDGEDPVTDLEGMASAYIAAMRSVQPSGPYLLGGWSMGGIVAFEMACQLTAAADRVGALIMFDSSAPDPDRDTSAVPPTLQGFAREHGLDLASFGALSEEAQIACLLERLKEQAVVPADLDLAAAQRLLRIFDANSRLLRSYRPTQPYRGPALLLSVEGRTDAARRAWQRHCAAGLEVVVVPGTHAAMMSAPFAGALASVVQRTLVRAAPRVASTAAP